jgi:hypothetical protein
MARDSVLGIEERAREVHYLSRLDSGLKPEKVDISSLVEDCLREMIPEFEERELAVDVDDGIAGRRIPADPEMIRIVIRNMIRYQVESARRGARIRISMNVVQSLPGCKEKIPWMALDIGLDPADGPQSRCHRVDAGPGESLIVWRRIISEHGGTFDYKVLQDATESFSVHLPIEC